MDERQAWNTIFANLPELAKKMLTLQKGTWLDVYCDVSGKKLSFSKPAGDANVKLASMTATDLEANYDIRPDGADYITGDGEKISKDELPNYLARMIKNIRDDGSEWGWEFRLAS